MARLGRVSVSCDYGSGNPYVVPYRVMEIESASKIFVGITSEESSQSSVTWYDDVDLSNTMHLDKMFNLGGINTYTWTEPMTEVPDEEAGIEYPISIANGGTGATTAAQALTNLGAVSVTALDALSTTVAGKADANHNHNNYVTSDTIDVIEDVLDSKADANHTHDYANVNHSHDNYATIANFDSLSNTVAGKADANHSHDNYALATHVHDGVYAEADHIHNYAPTSHGHSLATTSSDGFMSIADKTKLSGISDGAEVNQNAFTNIAVGSSVVAADVKTDTLTLAGSNVSLTADTVNDKITIGITKNNVTSALGYTPPEQDTTYSVATTSTNGLMSSGDKSKLNGIAEGANNYTLPTAGSSLGGVKTTSTVTSTSGYTACPIISGVPYYKDTNTTYSLSSFGITATAVELNKLDGVTATTAELNYIDGVTSNIQTQLNNKAAKSHTHSYLPLSGGTVTGNLIVNGTTDVGDLLTFNNPEKGIQGTHPTTGQKYHQFQPVNLNGDCAIGFGMYDAGIGSTDVYGQKVTLKSKSKIDLLGNVRVTSTEAGLSDCPYGVNQLLWSGTSYMESGKTAPLSKKVSEMPHGIVLIFSGYTVGTGAQNNYWHYFFIPKYAVGIDNGGGSSFTLMKGGKMYMKYIYINDTELTGSSDNNNSSFSLHGQAVDNRNFVLRYVVGV